MNIQVSKKAFTFSLCLVALLSFGVSYAFQNNWFNMNHRDPQVTVNVWVFRETPQGVEELVSGNVITDIGERYVRNILGFDNVTNHNATKWIALGNSTIDQTKTKLDTEATTMGFTRTLGTVDAWVNSGDYAYNVTKKFTATGNIAVNAASLQWSGVSNSDNNMFALASLGGTQSFQNSWNCTIRWVITWNAND